MCYAHDFRNVSKRAINDKNKKPEILHDISQLNLSTTKEYASKLFLKKYIELEPEFVEYFEPLWLGTHANWYEATAIYTNNAHSKKKLPYKLCFGG